jgi:copper(I)-binding protein
MRFSPMRLSVLPGLLLLAAVDAHAAGRLVVEHAWIRTAPPSALMLAGYATLRNDGDAPLTVNGADSTDFADVQLHMTVLEDGVERMRPTGKIEIAPGKSVDFVPGGKHFMLVRPKRELRAAAKVKIHISTTGGEGASADFVVRDEAP